MVFATQTSYLRAISARFMQLRYGNFDKKVGSYIITFILYTEWTNTFTWFN